MITIARKTVIRSTRIYADKLNKNTVDALCSNINAFNTAVYYAYNMLFDIEYYGKSYSEKSFYLHLQSKYPLFSVYYLNSIIQEAKGILSSQKELIKLHIEEKKAKINEIERKIKKEEKSLANYLKLKESFIKRSKAIKNNKKPGKFTSFQGSNIYLDKDTNNLVIRNGFGKNATVEPIGWTEAECYNQQRIKRTKSKIGQLKGRLNRLNEKLELLEKQRNKKVAPKKVCFGSKEFFKLKDTTDINLDDWKKEFNDRRNHSLMISGKSEGGFGNLAFKYDADTENLRYYTYDKKEFLLEKVQFPCGGDALKEELKNKDHGPIAYRLIKNYDKDNKMYFIIQATLTLPDKKIRFVPHNGVCAIDINPDRIDLVELNAYGCMINRQVFKMDLDGKSTDQITHIINNISAKIMKYCHEVDKPLVMEDLDFEESKRRLMYGNKKYHKMLSSFAYKHITVSLEARAFKDDVAIKKVNPAYTSLLAKTKYMRRMRLPIHTVAAMVIGRRGMGFEENIPTVYTKEIDFSTCKNKFAEYSKLDKTTKDIPINCFYKKITNVKDFVKDNKKVG